MRVRCAARTAEPWLVKRALVGFQRQREQVDQLASDCLAQFLGHHLVAPGNDVEDVA